MKYLLKHPRVLTSIKDGLLQAPFTNHLGFSNTKYYLSATLARRMN